MAKTKQEAQKTGQKTSEAKRPCSRSPVLETRSSSTNTVSCSRRLRGIDGSGPLDFKAFKRGVAKEVKTGISRKARDALTSLSKKRDKNDDFKLFGPKCLYEASKKQGFVKRLLGKKKKKGKLGEENHDNHPGFLAASLLVLLTSISILTYGIVKIQHLTTFKLTLVFVLFASGFILACCLFFHRKKTRNRQKIQPNETTPRSPLNSLRQKLRKKQLTGYSAEEQKILEELRKFALASLHKKTERQFNKLIFYICDELWLEDRGILTFKLMNIYLSQENSNTEKMILKEILCVALQEEAFLEKGILKKSAKSLSQKLQAKEQVEYSTADHEILKELHAFALVTLCDTKEKRFNVLISNIYQMLGLTEKEDRSSLTFQLNNIFINLNSEKIILEAIAAPMLYDCFGDSNQVYEYLDYLCATKLDKYEFGLCKPPYIKTSETSDSQFPSKMQLLREQALEAFCMLVKLNREGLPKLLSGIIKETKQKKTTTKAKVLRLLEEAHPSTVLLLFHLLENHLNFGAQQAESTLIKQIKKAPNILKDKAQIRAIVELLSSIKTLERAWIQGHPNERSLIFKYRYEPEHTQGNMRQSQNKPTHSASKKYVHRIKDALFSFWKIEQTSPEKLPYCIGRKAIKFMKSDMLLKDDQAIQRLAIAIAQEVIHSQPPDTPTSPRTPRRITETKD